MKPTISYPPGTDAMNQTPHTTHPNPPDRRAEPDPDVAPNSTGSGLVGWLKNFALYLGAVVVACATSIFFLWHIPILQDLPQWLKSVSDASPSRYSSSTVAPPIIPSRGQAPSPQLAPQTPAPAPGQPPAPTGAIVVTAPPATTPEFPAGPSMSPTAPEPQAGSEVAQVDPSAPPTETPAEDVVTPPTPQQEIERLLADARQQMDNRRLTSPTSGNALHSYQRVLELEPTNPVAIEGIQRIATYYQDIAKQSLLQGRTDESLAYLNRGLRAAPKNEALLNLRREIRLAKQREEEQRQALLAERRRQEAEQMRELSRQPPEEPPQQPWLPRQQQPPRFNESGFNQR
jgi:hypothetical protein